MNAVTAFSVFFAVLGVAFAVATYREGRRLLRDTVPTELCSHESFTFMHGNRWVCDGCLRVFTEDQVFEWQAWRKKWTVNDGPFFRADMASGESETVRRRWWTGKCECSICGHHFVLVVPLLGDEAEPVVPLECSACGNMTGSPE